MSTVALGIVLGLAGSIAINVGNNLQSRGMFLLEEERLRTTSSFAVGANDKEIDACTSTMWVCGTVVFVTGALLNFGSYGFAPQSLLATLESIQFVTNLFLGKWMQKKAIARKMYFGTFTTVVGTILAVSFSSKIGAKIEVIADLARLWGNGLWISYLIFISLLTLVLYATNKYYTKERGVTESLKNTMAVIYAIISALYGTLSVVFAKLLAELLDLQAQGISIFTHWFTYINLLCWLLLMTFWLVRLNNALRYYNPLIIIPLLQVNFIFFAIISGGIYFQEFNYMDAGQSVGFIIGIILMFSGIYLMMPPPEHKMPVRPRSTTIKKRQRQISEIFMSGPSRLNHNYNQLELGDLEYRKSTSLQPYIPSRTNSLSSSKSKQIPSMEMEEPRVIILSGLKRPTSQNQSVKKSVRFKINQSSPLGDNSINSTVLSASENREIETAFC